MKLIATSHQFMSFHIFNCRFLCQSNSRFLVQAPSRIFRLVRVYTSGDIGCPLVVLFLD